MPKQWYKRMLLSYVPIVVITVSAMIFVSFFIISEIQKKEAEKANRISATYVIDSMESTVRGIERAVLREMAGNRSLYEFIMQRSDYESALQPYYLSEDFNKLIGGNPAIHSIYVYRASDGAILTQQNITRIDRFPDKPFIMEQMSSDLSRSHLQFRRFTDQDQAGSESVITLTQRAPLPFGNQGLLVVDIRVQELVKLAGEMINRDITSLVIRDDKNRVIYPAHSGETDGQQPLAGNFTYTHYSPYLGWTFYSGIKAGKLSDWASVVAYIWMIFGVLIIASSMLAAVYLFKRNYKPVELIIERIQQYQLRNLTKEKASDEFAYIEKALENLVEQTKEYEKRHQEDLTIRRRQLLRELLYGNYTIQPKNWQETAERFGLPAAYVQLTVTVVELDKYEQFQSRNGESEQRFLKFSLAQVVNEFLHHENLHIETEWLSGERLAVLCIFRGEYGQDDTPLLKGLGTMRQWIWNNLSLSVRIGVGSAVKDVQDVPESLRQALTALQYKLTLGDMHAIPYDAVAKKGTGESFNYYMEIAECVQGMRLMSGHWETQAERIFDRKQEEMLPDHEIRSIVRYWLLVLGREFEGVGDSAINAGLQGIVGSLGLRMEEADELQDMKTAFTADLELFYKKYAAYKESHKYLERINDIRKYIEANYANPDLSLNHLSDKYDLKPKYVSQLFKDEFRMNFVDYLVQLRMEGAKKLLLETSEPVHEIAGKVGYATAISFGRMFKKAVGITPGDYRKLMSMPQPQMRGT